MKGIQVIRISILLLLFSTIKISLTAQEGSDRIPESKEVKMMVDSIAKLIAHYYINEQMGRSIGDYIIEQEKKGAYRNLSYKAFGKSLTEDFVKVSDDVHMSAFYNERKETQKASILANILDDYGAASNYGYVDTKISKENIGYLKVGHFTKWKFFNEAKKAADNSMEMLKNTDALIVDLRGNPGGFEDIVAYLMSYFFEGEGFHLQEYYCRHEDRKRSVSISKNLPGVKLPDLPVFILTDVHTGSAGESFAYMMKHLERATIVGDTTVGAGNGSNYYRVSDLFLVQIATWETINAVTKKSWEKTGVIPHINTSSEEAYDKAYELAQLAAAKHKKARMDGYEKLIVDFETALVNHNPQSSDENIIKLLAKCNEFGFYKEGDINSMGYDYFLQRKKPATAEVIFKSNTMLYPNSSNVYDSYAEALAYNGKIDLAINNFQKAVDLARKNGDADLNYFIENLEKTKKMKK